MANDSTVKAGSWGARTVEKILRIQETARDLRARSSTWSTRRARASPIRSRCSPGAAAPGASSTTRCSCAGRSRRSACSSARRAAGGAYIPAFCDVVVMVDGNASMYLGSPRMAEMVIGEKVTLEEMGGAQDALLGLGLRRRAREDRGGGDRLGAALPRATCRRTATQQPPAREPRAPKLERQDARARSSPPTRTSPST